MKYVGIIILATGLILGIFALNMNVSVEVDGRDYGYGISTPSVKVSNVNMIAQRQNFLIYSGILSVVGAILTGFGAMAPNSPLLVKSDSIDDSTVEEDLSSDDRITYRDGIYTVGNFSFDRIEDARIFAAENPENADVTRA
jgi:hypothetical protein